MVRRTLTYACVTAALALPVPLVVTAHARTLSAARSSHPAGHGLRRRSRPAASTSDTAKPGRLVWSDEFGGPALASPDSAKWGFDVGGGGWGNHELQSYTARSANASLDGLGHLVITARAERYTGQDGIARGYTSARLVTLHTFHFLYGRLEARIRVPSGSGLLPAFWTLGANAYNGPGQWPGCGEIDAMEVLGSRPDVLNGTLHGPWSWAPHGIGGTARSATPLSAGFHVYGVQWAPGRIDFLLDGATYATVRQSDLPAGAVWPFRQPQMLLLDLAVGGDWPGAPSSLSRFPARMVVDWVRVWQ